MSVTMPGAMGSLSKRCRPVSAYLGAHDHQIIVPPFECGMSAMRFKGVC